MTIAKYSIGPCVRPNIRHDNGFLDKFPKRGPTVSDHLQYQWWVGKLETAEAAQKLPFLPHNDISDALAAYRHFLEGTGKDRHFSYDRYVTNDPSGQTTLDSAVADAQQGAYELYDNVYQGKSGVQFDMVSTALAANAGSVRFPYPQTENWQKAIGAHNFWICANVRADVFLGTAQFHMEMTLHVEDMYNFNPGAQDIATGIPDSANGLFEVSGLAKQYMNVSELTRHVAWKGSPSTKPAVTAASSTRQRQPSDNRRVRNRL